MLAALPLSTARAWLATLMRYDAPPRYDDTFASVIRRYALSGLALHWHWVDMSVGILIGFDCLLRTGELLQLRVADIMMNDQLTFATINLPDTKGITDSVSVTDAALMRLLARFIKAARRFNHRTSASSF